MKSSVRRVEKPWGYELIWAETARYAGKVLHIRKGHQLSLQFHRKKEESIYVSRGRMTLLFEESPGSVVEVDLKEGDAHHIPPNRQHRMVAVEDCDVFEVSTPELDDVVRINDQYGRVSSS